MLLPRPFLAPAVHLSILSCFCVFIGPIWGHSHLYSSLISPNCCLVTQGVVMFQIWGKWNAEHNYLYTSSSMPQPAPGACQHFQASAVSFPTFFHFHSIKLSNSHSQRHLQVLASVLLCPVALLFSLDLAQSRPCCMYRLRPLSCDGALPVRVPLSPLQELELPEGKQQLWFLPPPHPPLTPPYWCGAGSVCVCWSRAWP